MRRFLTWSAKGVGRGFSVAALGVVAVAALGGHVIHGSPSRDSEPFRISASPSRLIIDPGSSARYRISIIRRRGFQGRVRMSVSGVPRHARAGIAFPGPSLLRAMVVVTTSVRTPAGRYRLRLAGAGGASSATIRVILIVERAKFGIAGKLTGLEPGIARALNLSLTNSYGRRLSVTNLMVRGLHVSAPRSTAKLRCTLADFAVRQFSGSYPLVLPRRSTRALSDLGVPPAKQPQVILRNRPVDQDGCQKATLTVVYNGSAVLRLPRRRTR